MSEAKAPLAPLRKIVGLLDAGSGDPYGRRKVELECGHSVWCSSGAIYRARCRHCKLAAADQVKAAQDQVVDPAAASALTVSAGIAEALNRMDALVDPKNGLLAVSDSSATVAASRADMRLIRAAIEAAGAPTDEQICDAVECEFSATGEWPHGDVAVVRAFLKHRVAPTQSDPVGLKICKPLGSAIVNAQLTAIFAGRVNPPPPRPIDSPSFSAEDLADYADRCVAQELSDLAFAVHAGSRSAAEGYALVPLRLTAPMKRVIEEDDWDWPDLLAAANAVSLEDYEVASAGGDQAAELLEWRSMPIEPTEDMLLAAEVSKPRGYRELYAAMLKAAPAGPIATHKQLKQAISDERELMIEILRQDAIERGGMRRAEYFAQARDLIRAAAIALARAA